MSIRSRNALLAMGFASVGEDVRVSQWASLQGVSRIALADHVRIVDFCVLSAGTGGIIVGSYVHIGVGSSLIGAAPIRLEDFATISSRVTIYTGNDDYSGATMTGPMVPAEYTGYHIAEVALGRHVIVGSGSVILPGVILGEGVAMGALSLVDRNCAAFGIYAGIFVRPIKERKRDLLEVERRFRASTSG